MRLINAGELIAGLKELYMRAGWGLREKHFSLADMICNIEGEKKVDAIPVEFIEKRAQEYASNPEDSADLFAAGVIQMIITAWRAERKEE